MKYPKGLLGLLLSGDLAPANDRVFLRAVTHDDTNKGGIILAGEDLRRVNYHEVLACSPDVPANIKERLFKGALVRTIEAACDVVDGDPKNQPYVMTKWQHIISMPSGTKEDFERAVKAECEKEAREQEEANAEYAKLNRGVKKKITT